MSLLHNQAALFGAIDDEVVSAKKRLADPNSTTLAADRAIVQIVEGFLPGTTGFGRSGWFREIADLFARTATSEEHGLSVFPDLDEAIAGLQRLPSQRERSDSAPSADSFEERKPYIPANDPVLARAGYAAMVLNKVYSAKADGHAAPPGLLDVMATAVRSFSFVSRADGLIDDQLIGDDAIESIAERLFVADGISTRGEWLMLAASQQGFDEASATRSFEFAQSAEVCYGRVVKSKGKYCSIVTSEYVAPDVSVAAIENILDPINWKECSKFFSSMTMNQPARTKLSWSRVNEQVSAEPAKYHLEVDLLFWKAKHQSLDGSLLVNYDMDPQQKPSCLVEVDNGYILVTPENDDGNGQKPGVRIRSTKCERIQGVSTSAMAALACVMGWNDAGREMLAGTARKVITDPNSYPNLKKFYPSTEVDPAEI
ncbi:MAG: hypothetical protein HYZ38_09085 [Mycobacterium sp.]|nr:hypothetical protein [Mycobacterium sp.]